MSRTLVHKENGYEFYAEVVEIGQDDEVEEHFYEVFLSEDGDDYLFDALTLDEATEFSKGWVDENGR